MRRHQGPQAELVQVAPDKDDLEGQDAVPVETFVSSLRSMETTHRPIVSP
jgi:hypothetical protein